MHAFRFSLSLSLALALLFALAACGSDAPDDPPSPSPIIPPAKDPNAKDRGWQNRTAMRYRQPREGQLAIERRVIRSEESGHLESLSAAAFSSDSKWAISTANDASIALWQVTKSGDLKLARRWKEEGLIYRALLSGQGKWAFTSAVGASDSLYWIGDTNASNALEAPKRRLEFDWAVTAFAFSDDGHWALASGKGSAAALIKLSESEAPTIVHELKHDWEVSTLAFSRDGAWALTGSGDASAKLWHLDGKGGATESALLQHSGAVMSVAFSDDGKFAATGSIQGELKLWLLDGKGGASECDSHQFEKGIFNLFFLPQRNRFVCEMIELDTTLWSIGDDSRASMAAELPADVRWPLAEHLWSSDGRFFITGDASNRMALWQLEGDAQPLKVAYLGNGSDEALNTPTLSRDGSVVLACREARDGGQGDMPGSLIPPSPEHQAGLLVCIEVYLPQPGKVLAAVK